MDGGKGDDSDFEVQANEWAANALVPKKAWANFVSGSPDSEQAVRSFADRQGIAPGIIVSMLQHERRLPCTDLNKLKVRYKWGS